MNQIEIFNSPEFGSIRTLEQNGKVLFCGTDVATALGYTNPRKAVRDHTRGGTKCSIGVQTGKKADGSPAVQMVEMLFIPEGDLYRLIAHSKLPSAERFEQWVFDEVLPAIRKHGAYLTKEKLWEIATSPEALIKLCSELLAEREVRGFYRNLVVAATGTGKTVISAFDYRRFCRMNAARPCRLLFVAHREEILRQSQETFQGVLKDQNFGELFVGNHKPESLDNLFVSIQTMNSQALHEKLPEDYYDFIIVDEFHHAAAPTYQTLLNHFKPNILLGLTATPERKDGKSILDYFDNRIAAEIRLPEAIDRKLLSPFQYFGVTDAIDTAGTDAAVVGGAVLVVLIGIAAFKFIRKAL